MPRTIYALALSTLLFGRTLFAMHFPTALGSAGMVFAAFWLGRLLFGRDEEGEQATPWRGLLVGGVGAGLMAVSISQTIMGRQPGSYNHMYFRLCFSHCVWGCSGGDGKSEVGGGSRWQAHALGCCRIPIRWRVSRLVLFVFLGLSFLAPLRAVSWGKVRQELRWAALFAGVAALGGSAAARPFCSASRTPFHAQQASVGIRSCAQSGGPAGDLSDQCVGTSVSIFGLRGDPHWRKTTPVSLC